VFLHANFKEEIYITQPDGFIEENKKHLVCRLTNRFRVWNRHLDVGINNMIPSLWAWASIDVKLTIMPIFIVWVMVVSLFCYHINEYDCCRHKQTSVAALKAHLGREFNMKNMVAVNQKLGMIVHRYRQNE